MKVAEILSEQGVPRKGKALWGGNTKSGAAKYGKKMGSQTLPGYTRAEGGVKIKPRPKKNLWFQDQRGWNADLRFSQGNFALWRIKRNAQEEEEVFYAGNETGDQCYGYWQPKINQGMTFFKTKPMNVVKVPRSKLEKVNTGHEYWDSQ